MLLTPGFYLHRSLHVSIYVHRNFLRDSRSIQSITVPCILAVLPFDAGTLLEYVVNHHQNGRSLCITSTGLRNVEYVASHHYPNGRSLRITGTGPRNVASPPFTVLIVSDRLIVNVLKLVPFLLGIEVSNHFYPVPP